MRHRRTGAAVMLHEIKNVRQEPNASGSRRWFESDGFDLVVWYGADRAVTGFQICYETPRGEFALTWRDGAGFAHNAVDEGDGGPVKNQTPILVPDGRAPWPLLVRRFGERSGALEPALRDLVARQLAAGQRAS
jgi:hypothetical protein